MAHEFFVDLPVDEQEAEVGTVLEGGVGFVLFERAGDGGRQGDDGRVGEGEEGGVVVCFDDWFVVGWDAREGGAVVAVSMILLVS